MKSERYLLGFSSICISYRFQREVAEDDNMEGLMTSILTECTELSMVSPELFQWLDGKGKGAAATSSIVGDSASSKASGFQSENKRAEVLEVMEC